MESFIDTTLRYVIKTLALAEVAQVMSVLRSAVSQPGHMPGLRAQSPVEGSLSKMFLSLKISKSISLKNSTHQD